MAKKTSKNPFVAMNPLTLLPKPKSLTAQQQYQYQQSQTALQQTTQQMQQQGVRQPIPGYRYAHPQPWRVAQASTGGPYGAGAQLGPMQILPPELIFSIELDPKMYYEIEQAMRISRSPFSERELLSMVRGFLYEPVRQITLNTIRIYAPKDSGRLRNVMELSIQGGSTGGGASSTSQLYGLRPFYMVLSTGNVPYASVVNKMPEQWLKHPGTHPPTLQTKVGRTGSRRRKHLHDPLAESDWFHKILETARLKAWDAYERFLRVVLQPYLAPAARQLGIPENILAIGLLAMTIPGRITP